MANNSDKNDSFMFRLACANTNKLLARNNSFTHYLYSLMARIFLLSIRLLLLLYWLKATKLVNCTLYCLGWFFSVHWISKFFSWTSNVGKNENTHLRWSQHSAEISYITAVNHRIWRINKSNKNESMGRTNFIYFLVFGCLCVMLLMVFVGYFIANSHFYLHTWAFIDRN